MCRRRRYMKRRKRFLGLCLVSLFALSVLAGCGKQAQEEPVVETEAKQENEAEEEKTEYTPCSLSFAWWGEEARNQATIKALKAFEEKYPGIEVNLIYGEWDGWEDIMAQQFANGTAPDISQINWNWIFNFSADGSVFYDLYEAYEVLDLGAFGQEYLNMCTVNGKLQAIPVSMTGRIFFYNQSLFERAGLATPTTLQDLLAAGSAFQSRLGEEYYPLALGEYDRMILLVYYLESVYGKEWVVDDVLQYSAQEVAKGMEFLLSLEDAHVIPDLASMSSLEQGWTEGNYGGVFAWDTEVEQYRGSLPAGQNMVIGEELKDLGPYDGGFSKVAMAFAISEKCAHKREAALLLEFLFNQEEGVTYMGSYRGIPLSRRAYEYCSTHGLLDEMTFEANRKVLEHVSFELDPQFENLKNDNDVYYVYSNVMNGLSYKDYNAQEAAQLLLDGIEAGYRRVSDETDNL